MKTRTLITTASALLLGSSLVLAQTSTGSNTADTTSASSAMVGSSFSETLRQSEDAARHLEQALRSAYKFDYLSTNSSASVTLPDGLAGTAQQLLDQAQQSYTDQNYFQAGQQAAAAEKIYRALEKIFSANGVSLPYAPAADAPTPPVGPGPRGGGPKGPGPLGGPAAPTSGDALYRAQEEVYILNQEMAYYDASTDTVSGLISAAQSLLEQAQTAASPTSGQASSTSSDTAQSTIGLSTPIDATSAYADAAGEVARAGRDLVSAERGF